MDAVTIIGFIGASLTSVSFVPQLIRIVKVKETRDISLGMYVLLAIGFIMWLTYGTIRKDIVIIIANVVSLVLCSLILFFKLKYK